MLDVLYEEIETLLIEHAARLPSEALTVAQFTRLLLSTDEIAARVAAPTAFVEEALAQLADNGVIVEVSAGRWDVALEGETYLSGIHRLALPG